MAVVYPNAWLPAVKVDIHPVMDEDGVLRVHVTRCGRCPTT